MGEKQNKQKRHIHTAPIIYKSCPMHLFLPMITEPFGHPKTTRFACRGKLSHLCKFWQEQITSLVPVKNRHPGIWIHAKLQSWIHITESHLMPNIIWRFCLQFVEDGQNWIGNETIAKLCISNSQLYRVIFLTGPSQKSSKYGTGPTQQWKND